MEATFSDAVDALDLQAAQCSPIDGGIKIWVIFNFSFSKMFMRRSISRKGLLSFSRRKLAATILIYFFVNADSVISSIGFCEEDVYGDELGLPSDFTTKP